MPYLKDESYAWVVVGAGSIIMFVGSSTYDACGTLFAPMEMSDSYRIWIVSLLFTVCFGVAPLAGPLAVANTHRKIVMFGLFIAVCGLTLTGVLHSSPSWTLLTFSTFTGLGIGLAIHETLLLIVCHFEKFRGISVGLLQVSCGLSQIVTPFIYEGLEDMKDRFYIRALMTAVAFMGASFYISPTLPPPVPITDEELGEALELQEQASRRSSTNTEDGNSGSRRQLYNDDQAPLIVPSRNTRESANEPQNVIPVENSKTSSNSGPHKTESNLVVSTLANIPEEAEQSPSASTEKFEELMKRFQISPIDPELEQKIALKISKGRSSSNDGKVAVGLQYPQPTTRVQPLDPELLRRIDNTINPKPKSKKVNGSKLATQTLPGNPPRLPHHQRRPHHQAKKPSKDPVEGSARQCNNIGMFRYRLDSIFDPEMEFMEVIGKYEERKKPKKKQGLVQFWKGVFKQVDLSLFRNMRFLNMAVGSAVTLVAFPNFPILLTSYIMLLERSNGNTDNFETVENALVYISSADISARLAMAYLSDYKFFNRKIGFLAGSLVGGIVIMATCAVQDTRKLLALCCLYGVCYGTLVVTESLMLADAFGIHALPAGYGIMNGLKAVLVLLATPVVGSPVSYLVYTVHPFKTMGKNETTCSGLDCDPLGIFNEWNEPSQVANQLSYVTWLFRFIALPGLGCSAMWVGEMIWDYWMNRTKSDTLKPEDSTPQVRKPAPPPKRARSSSNPLA